MAKKASTRVKAESDGTVGRPAYELTEDQLKMVDGMAEIQCTDDEIAALLDVSPDWVAKKKANDPDFSTRIEKGRERGKESLRRKQYKLAEKGHPTMLIWLGKQVLGQRDKFEHAGPDGGPIKTQQTIDLSGLSTETLKRIREELGE